MKGILAAVAAVVVVVGGVRADDKIDEKKLVGKWELTKSDDENAPKGAVIEFTKDNKLTVTIEFNGKELKLNGTYKVDGNKLTVKLTSPDGKEEEDTDTVKSLTDEKLVLVDKKDKTTELTKKK